MSKSSKSFFQNLKCEVCGIIFEGYFFRKRKTCSKECSTKLKKLHAGSPKGIPMTERRKKILSIVNSGEGNPFYGKTHKLEVREKIGLSLLGKYGEQSRRWVSDRTRIKRDTERGGQLHRFWSLSVKRRDDWKCRILNSDCEGKVVAHHILGWIDFPELRYEINNGITLCHAHHPRRRAEEKRLIPFFTELVPVSKE